MGAPVCQVLYMTSLALGSLTNISLEVSTPGVGEDNGFALCFMGSDYNLTEAAAALQYSTGGHQFDSLSETPLISLDKNVTTFTWLLNEDQTYTSPQAFR